MNIEEDINILKQLIREYKRKPETQNEFFIGLIEERALENLLTAYEEEKEKNKELTERVLKLESDKFWDNVVSKSKIKQIIYPTPENEIPIEIQQSEMYKKLVKEVEE